MKCVAFVALLPNGRWTTPISSCDAVNAHEIALAAIAYVECQFQPFGKASCDVWIRLHEAVLAWRATGLSDGIAREIEAL